MKQIQLYILFFFCFSFGFSQTQQEKLEARKEQIQKEISAFKELLQTEKKKERSVLSEIAAQKARIRLSERLISTTAKQKRILDDNIYLNQLEINKLNRELKVLKEDYAKMIVKSYKSRNDQSRIMFILSSQNFLQAYKRIQYMKQYAGFRKMQGDEIQEKQDKLGVAVVKLEKDKKNKEKVIAENEAEKKTLEEKRKEQEQLAKIIQKDKKKYAADIDKKQKESKEIDRQIKKIIADEIAAANKRNAAKTGSTASTSSVAKFDLTPEGKIVSDNFKLNKGKLPWPVDNGYVQLRYGDQPHPVHKNLTVHNSGVEIATKPGSNARAIFGGVVLQVQVISANNKAVYVQHGDFITVYLNLSSVNVSKGDQVAIKQLLGKIHTDSSGSAVIKFLVLQNTTYLNPEQWMSNM
ncbi:MAG: peptidoglycan DD-metalloendopeptidase family protein [Flavobacterium sp.]|jgi:septal ring factor EnvC (AmiA/AmiB activator)